MKFSIITPCFNSTKTLRRTYESLCNQTFKDFEWILIDDGSTDTTKDLILALKEEAPFNVQYKFLDQNYFGSKSVFTACNLAKGEYACVLDHDDQVTPEALEIVAKQIEKYQSQKDFAGVCGRCVNERGDFIGQRFPKEEEYTCEGVIRFKYKNTAELFQFTKIDLMKPWFEKIKPGYTNGFIWSNLAVDHKMVYINDVLRIYDTALETSYSNSKEMVIRNPKEKAEALKLTVWAYREYLIYNPKYALTLMGSLVRHKLNAGESLIVEQPRNAMIFLLNILALPLGYLKYKKII